MGVCCSKKGVVAVKETTHGSKESNGFLTTEVTGKTGEQTGNLDPPNVIESPREIPIRETETVNTYDTQSNSANRSTLIFPTYSGYKTSNTSSPAFSGKTTVNHETPKAYVSPFQSGASGSPLTNRSALDYMTNRSSPTVTRYSPLVTPTLQRRNIPSPFAIRSAKVTGDVGGDFDSDLDSNSDSEQSPVTSSQVEPLNFTLPHSTLPIVNVTNETQTNNEEHLSAAVAMETCDVGTDATQDQQQVQMVDVCVGTNDDDVTRSHVSTQRNVRSNKPKKKSMSSMAVGTDEGRPSSRSNISTQSEKPKKLPKIVTEHIDEKPKRQKRSPSPRPPSSGEHQEREKPKPDPIIETLENAFYRFARYGEVNSEGKEMNNKNWAKLCRDCDFVDNRTVLVGDIDVIFSRHKHKGERLITFEMFLKCLNEIADRRLGKRVKDEKTRREVVYNNVIGKAPELVGVTGVSRTGNVDRMTDHTLYPAGHKMRFDEEGRGLGIDEKFEYIDAQFGYVNGYKGRDQYDQKFVAPISRSGSMISTSGRPHSSSSSIRPGSNASRRSQSPR